VVKLRSDWLMFSVIPHDWLLFQGVFNVIPHD
jgi:hypothetical protein